MSTDEQNPLDSVSAELLQQVRAAMPMLQAIAANTSLLEDLPLEDRRQLHECIGRIYMPNPAHRRQQRKVAARERVQAKIRDNRKSVV